MRRLFLVVAATTAFVVPFVLPGALQAAHAQDIECSVSGIIIYNGPTQPNQAYGGGQAACTGNPLEIVLYISIGPAYGGTGTPMYGLGQDGLIVPGVCTSASGYCWGSAGNSSLGSISYNHCWQLNVQATVNGIPYKTFPQYKQISCF